MRNEELVGRLEELASAQQLASDHIGAYAKRCRDHRDSAIAAVDATEQVQRDVERSRQSVEALGLSAEELSEMARSFAGVAQVLRAVAADLAVIEEIAVETNILGINAAIESARAGEHGRGFAVVASSMRELSRQSRQVVDRVGESLRTIAGDVERVSVSAQRSATSNAGHVVDATERLRAIDEGAAHVVARTRDMATRLTQEEAHVTELGQELLQCAERTAGAVAETIGQVEGAIVDLSPAEANGQLARFTVIDVRNADELASELGHIRGCVNHPLGADLEAALAPLPRDTPYLFVCRKGGRSARAAQLARGLGFHEIYNLDGGMERWNEAGLPTARMRLARAG